MPDPERSRRISRHVLLLVAAVALTGGTITAIASLGGGGSSPETGSAVAIERVPPRTHESRPNVVVIMTDDQVEASMRVMPKVRRLIGSRGVTFANSFVNLPLCCPSRATFFTGQYVHNHGVSENGPPEGGFERLDSSETLPVWLSRAGVATAHIGRYLNHYGVGEPPDNHPELVPPGWSSWYGLPHSSAFRYFGFTLNENGRLVEYGRSARDYQTDVLTRTAVSYIRSASPRERPFFLSVGYLAPHSGGPKGRGYCGDSNPKPAGRHERTFADRRLPRLPSFNEGDVSDKPRFIRRLPPLTRERIRGIEERFRCRLESLLAVDDGVERIVQALRRTGELERTYLIFTSDNGLFQGEHRRKGRKLYAYEEVSRVPLLIRGPGIPRGKVSEDLAINADLAPTALEAMGASAGLPVDGTSLLGPARHPERQRGRALLIESPGEYAAIRTHRYIFIRHATGERELYDLARDPYELESRAGSRPYRRVEERLAGELSDLRDCSGAECRGLSRPGLELDYRRGPDGCAKGPVSARIELSGSPELRAARFYMNGQVARAPKRRPYEARFSRRLLRREGSPVSARADLIDGRRVELRGRVTAC